MSDQFHVGRITQLSDKPPPKAVGRAKDSRDEIAELRERIRRLEVAVLELNPGLNWKLTDGDA